MRGGKREVAVGESKDGEKEEGGEEGERSERGRERE